MASEFGFIPGDEGTADNGEYGKRIIAHLEEKGISWIAWMFDPEW